MFRTPILAIVALLALQTHDSLATQDNRGIDISVSDQKWDNILEDFERTKTLKLDGHKWDNTLIRNCKIHDTKGFGIRLGNVNNVYITNCEIYNTGDMGILVVGSKSTSNITVDGNKIYNTTKDGIHASQRSKNGFDVKKLKIINNFINNTGLAHKRKLSHGIYIQTQDYLIEGNTIMNSRDGDGISVRSSGIVRGNVVGLAAGSPIDYFADHLRGPSNTLLIENNIVYGNGFHKRNNNFIGNKTPATIDILRYKNRSLVVENIIVRFNTVISFRGDRYALRAHKSYRNMNLQAYGNLLVNTRSKSSILIGPRSAYNQSNYLTTSLGNFISSTEPYNFHLTKDHEAIGFATKEPNFPAIDIDGNYRSDAHLDAGADQVR